MKTKQLQNMLTAIAALFIATFVLPISANAKTSYGIIVGNTPVSTDNYNNITGDYIKPYNTSLPYEAYYTPSTKTLYLKNVKIERSGSNNRCITNKTCYGLTVVFEGDNYFFAKNASAIRCEKNTTLEQATGASVTVSSTEQEAIFACNTALLTIKNGIFTCASDKKAIIGGDGKEILKLDNTTITGSTNSALRFIVDDFAKVVLLNSTIKGETSSTPVIGIGVVPKSRTDIEVLGTNNIETFFGGIRAYSKTTISGNGTLNITSENSYAIQTYGTQLAIEGCTVNAKGKWGIKGTDLFKGPLAFTNANVTINSSEACISYIKTLALDGCAITQPSGAAFSTSLYGVALGGTLVKGKVVIGNGASGIASPTVDIPAKKHGIYTMQGMKMQGDFNRLPAGIYIVDGRKVVKH